MRDKLFQIAGVGGTAACIILFGLEPSWPTPDKLFIFLLFVFMMFRSAKQLFIRLAPFVGLLLVYETLRGFADSLNRRVAFMWMPRADEKLFGSLPTAKLQQWLWHGQVQWFDLYMYVVYMLHFVLPIALALVIWKLRESFYWQYITAYLVVSFAGFLTFLAFPAAPPWMAADKGMIMPIHRISSDVWHTLGVHDFPSVYNRISPNPVAAVPSLHAAFATLFAMFVFKLFGKKWGALSLIYPLTIYFGTVYQGEHYAIDEIIGALYGVATYLTVQAAFKRAWRVSLLNRWQLAKDSWFSPWQGDDSTNSEEAKK